MEYYAMKGQPLISVVLCTYNNADSLKVTLSQLKQCEVSDCTAIEILIVDNNSSDDTRQIVKQMSANCDIDLRYLFEPQQGLSNARNLGLREASGQYILFTDDDADIPANWIECYERRIKETNADCLYSKIEIIWDQSVPWWFDDRYNPYFVHLNYGDDCIIVEDNHHEFFGKNFCCRKSILQDLGGFDEKLGRKGASLAAGEETVIYRKLIEQGAKLFYFPDAIVGHRLKAVEYTEGHIEKKFVDGGTSSWHIANHFSSRRLCGRPLYPLLMAFTNTFHSITVIPYYCVSNNHYNKELFYRQLQLKQSLQIIKLWIWSR